MNDKLTFEDIENIEAAMKVGGKFHRPINLSIALQQLAATMRENERWRNIARKAIGEDVDIHDIIASLCEELDKNKELSDVG